MLACAPPVIEPPLTAEQTERYKELLTRVEDMVYQEIDKYITGEEPIENYDQVIAAAREAGRRRNGRNL